MTRDISHWRDISKQQLQWMLSILKDAEAPLTQGDVRRELDRRGLSDKIEAIPTVIWEIGKNHGYRTSGGVRFPDGKWRYWLIAAPGWTPRWSVTKDYKIVPAEQGNDLLLPSSIDTSEPRSPLQADEKEVLNIESGTWNNAPRRCRHCERELANGSANPFCSEDCEQAYWDHLTGKKDRE